jgi:hypothetical protein
MVWAIDPAPVLIEDNLAIVFDLSPTLPAQVRRGGQFAISPSGSPLPPGVVLAPEGILLVTLVADVSSTNNVVFSYTEP